MKKDPITGTSAGDAVRSPSAALHSPTFSSGQP